MSNDSHAGWKLTVEFIPPWMYRKSLRYLMSDGKWQKLRKEIISRYNSCCAICHKESTFLGLWQRWFYNDIDHVQILEAVLPLCRECTHLKHFMLDYQPQKEGRTNEVSLDLVEHFCKVNNCTPADFYAHLHKTRELYSRRADHSWTIDYGEYHTWIDHCEELQQQRLL